MPELPEVESIVRELKPKVCGRTIKKADIISARPSGGEYRGLECLQDNLIMNVSRRGKCIILDLSGGYKLLFHLGMTGQLLYRETFDVRAQYAKLHVRVVFQLGDDGNQLLFTDMRRFGWIELQKPDEQRRNIYLKKLGPDALSVGLQEFRDALVNKKAVIKGLLLNQSVISGIGNIYADETLYESGMHPLRKANTLSESEIRKLYHSIRKVLTRAISYGGSTIRNYKLPDGTSGGFQEKHKVYGRQGKACPICSTAITRLRVAGRGTYICPQCQVAE